MTPDLDRAVEQFVAAMGPSLYGHDPRCETEYEIVEALLAAGWRPPEVTG